MPFFRLLAILGFILFAPLVKNAYAESADAVTRLWEVAGGDGRIEI